MPPAADDPGAIRIPGSPVLRVHGDPRGAAVLILGGSSYRDAEGVWSATAEWLCRRLADERPGLQVVEMRYRNSSWRRLGMGVQDGSMAVEALAAAGRAPRALIGFSFGGTVAIAVAGAPSVATVVGIAPWVPGGLDLSPLRGRRLRLLHGTLDGRLPGVPGVPPSNSHRAAERARELGIDVELTEIAGAVHGIAIRVPWGLMPLPRADRFVDGVVEELDRLVAA